MCVSMCMHARNMYVCAYACACMCVIIGLCVHVPVCVYVGVPVCVCACMHANAKYISFNSLQTLHFDFCGSHPAHAGSCTSVEAPLIMVRVMITPSYLIICCDR